MGFKRKLYRISTIVLIVLFIAFSQNGLLWNSGTAYADSSHPVIKTAFGGVANIYWNNSRLTNIDKISMDVSISEDIDPSLNLYIAALGGYFNDVGFYCGIQTNTMGWASKKDQTSINLGKGGIFSRWDERSLDAISIAGGGICQSAGYEGDFVGIRNTCKWGKGSYNIELRTIKSGFGIKLDNSNIWLGMFIYSYQDKTDTYMGAIRFPGTSLSLKEGTLYSFVELYGSPVPVDKIPKRAIGFSNLRVNGSLVSLGSTCIGYQKNTSNTGKAVVTDKELQIVMGQDVNDPSKYNYVYSQDRNYWYEYLDVSRLTHPEAPLKPDVTENPDPLQKPDGLTVTTDLYNAYLKWNEPADAQKSGLIGYYVYRVSDAGGAAVNPLKGKLIKETSYTDSTVLTGNTYYYYVTAVNKYENESAASDKAVVKTNDISAPAGLKAKRQGKSIRLSWNKSSTSYSDEVIGYNVYRGTVCGEEELTPVNSKLIAGTDFTDSVFYSDQTYFYVVEAVNKYGVVSGASNEVTVSGDVGKPANLKVQPKQKKAILTWGAPRDRSAGDIAGYNVYRGTASGKEGTIPVNKQLVKGLSFTDLVLGKNKTYFYYVKAVNVYGVSSPASNEVKVK